MLFQNCRLVNYRELKEQNFEKKFCIPLFMGKWIYQCIFGEKNYTQKYRLKQHVLRQHFFKKLIRREQNLYCFKKIQWNSNNNYILVWYRTHQQMTKLRCFKIWDVNPTTLQPLNKPWQTDHELCTTFSWVTCYRYNGLLEAEPNFDRGNGGKNFK